MYFQKICKLLFKYIYQTALYIEWCLIVWNSPLLNEFHMIVELISYILKYFFLEKNNVSIYDICF